ncbi:hypothetical protein D3C72_2125140 [compost metagenome]
MLRRLGQLDFQTWAKFHQGAQVRHAAPGRHVAGAGRQGQGKTDIEVEAVRIEQARAHARAVGAQHFPAINQIGQGQAARRAFAGAGIGGRDGRAAKYARFP